MDWFTFNGLMSSIVGLILARIVLSPGIEEGLIIKSGLITMIFSLLSTAVHMFTKSEDVEALVRSGTALVTGIGLVIVGVFVKNRSGHPWFAHTIGGK